MGTRRHAALPASVSSEMPLDEVLECLDFLSSNKWSQTSRGSTASVSKPTEETLKEDQKDSSTTDEKKGEKKTKIKPKHSRHRPAKSKRIIWSLNLISWILAMDEAKRFDMPREVSPERCIQETPKRIYSLTNPVLMRTSLRNIMSGLVTWRTSALWSLRGAGRSSDLRPMTNLKSSPMAVACGQKANGVLLCLVGYMHGTQLGEPVDPEQERELLEEGKEDHEFI